MVCFIDSRSVLSFYSSSLIFYLGSMFSLSMNSGSSLTMLSRTFFIFFVLSFLLIYLQRFLSCSTSAWVSMTAKYTVRGLLYILKRHLFPSVLTIRPPGIIILEGVSGPF